MIVVICYLKTMYSVSVQYEDPVCQVSYIDNGGNRFLDPCFCGPATGDYTLSADSPCLPGQHPECGLVGALGEGCSAMGCGEVFNESLSWGDLKTLYR